uniref:Uncharacterized protein n=1 Tax=Ascaris lumbricoides TaxID=6252 RepID=A0A0M3HM69_ASCLU
MNWRLLFVIFERSMTRYLQFGLSFLSFLLH